MIEVGPASPTNLTYSVTTRSNSSNQPIVLGIFFFCPFQISLKSHAPPPTTPLCWSCNLVQRKKIKIKKSRCTLGAGGENGQKQGTDFLNVPLAAIFFFWQTGRRRTDDLPVPNQSPIPSRTPGVFRGAKMQHACVGEFFTMRQQKLLKCQKEELVVTFQKKKKKAIMTQ